MKKTLIFALIITIACILCSCNLDAQDGIHSAIASSTKESGTKITSYLGYFDSCYYILTDTSISRIGEGSISFTSIPAIGSSIDDRIDEAALLSDGSILVAKHSGKIYKYNKNGTLVGELKENLNSIALMTNGTFFADYNGTEGLYNSDGTLIKEIANMKTILESGEYTLVETSATDDPAKYYIYKGSSLVSSGNVGDTSDYVTVGFQAISDTKCYILKDNNQIYLIEGSTFDKPTEFVKISYTLANGKTYSFTYSETSDDDTKNYIVVKASENFVKINLADSEDVTYVTSGYGSLKQNLVVNIKPDEKEEGQFILATSSNSLWRINPKTTDNPVDLL